MLIKVYHAVLSFQAVSTLTDLLRDNLRNSKLKQFLLPPLGEFLYLIASQVYATCEKQIPGDRMRQILQMTALNETLMDSSTILASTGCTRPLCMNINYTGCNVFFSYFLYFFVFNRQGSSVDGLWHLIKISKNLTKMSMRLRDETWRTDLQYVKIYLTNWEMKKRLHLLTMSA